MAEAWRSALMRRKEGEAGAEGVNSQMRWKEGREGLRGSGTI